MSCHPNGLIFRSYHQIKSRDEKNKKDFHFANTGKASIAVLVKIGTIIKAIQIRIYFDVTLSFWSCICVG